MAYTVHLDLSASFHRQLAAIRKKHRKVDLDLDACWREISNDPFLHGDVVPGLGLTQGHSVVKIRVASSDLQSGKSGGFRVGILVDTATKRIIPFMIYRKSDMEQPKVKDVLAWIKDLSS